MPEPDFDDPSGFSFGGGMAEGQSSVSGNYGGMPSGGIASGVGRQDGPGSPTEGNPFGGPKGSPTEGTSTEQGLVASINAQINAGQDPNPNTIAADILAGKYGSPANFGINNVDMNRPEISDFMDKYGSGNKTGVDGLASLVGYNPNIGFTQNLVNMTVPGKNTPLGALSAVPGLTGASKTVQGIVGLANAVAGKLGMGSTTNPSAKTGITSGISIADKYAAPDIENYTGRPDDAPAKAQTEAGQFMQDNYTAPTTSDMPPGTEQLGFNLEDITNFQMPTVSMPPFQPAPNTLPLNDVLEALDLPSTFDFSTPIGGISVGFEDDQYEQ